MQEYKEEGIQRLLRKIVGDMKRDLFVSYIEAYRADEEDPDYEKLKKRFYRNLDDVKHGIINDLFGKTIAYKAADEILDDANLKMQIMDEYADGAEIEELDQKYGKDAVVDAFMRLAWSRMYKQDLARIGRLPKRMGRWTREKEKREAMKKAEEDGIIEEKESEG